MTDNDKPGIQNSDISNEAEATIATPIPTDDGTLVHASDDALTDKIQKEPTKKLFQTEVDVNAETHLQTSPNTEPTDILSKDEAQTNEELAENENSLKPSKLRFVLVCFLFALMFVSLIGFYYQLYLLRSEASWTGYIQEEQIIRIFSIEDDYLRGKLQVGDEIINVNGQPYGEDGWYKVRTFEPTKPLCIRNAEVSLGLKVQSLFKDKRICILV